MNNSRIISDAFAPEEEPDLVPTLELKKTELETMLVAIRFLKSNEYFNHYKKIILDTKIDAEIEKLKTEKDINEVARLQGFITSRALFDLAKLEQFYKAHLEDVKGRLQKELTKSKNAKT